MSEYEFWHELENIFDAVTAYQKKSIEFNRTFISPWVRLGYVFPREASSQEGLQTTLHAAELDPQNPQVWVDLGDTFLRSESLEEAADSYRKAIELDPAPASKNKLGHILVAQGRYHDAIRLYAESLQQLTDDRDKAVIWNRLGDAYRKLGDFENAVSAFLKADELQAARPAHRDLLEESADTEAESENPGPDLEPAANTVAELPQIATAISDGCLPPTTLLPISDDASVPAVSQNIIPSSEKVEDTDLISEFEKRLLSKLHQGQEIPAEEPEPLPRFEAPALHYLPESDELEKEVIERAVSETPFEPVPCALAARIELQEEMPEDTSPVANAEEGELIAPIIPGAEAGTGLPIEIHTEAPLISAGENFSDAPFQKEPSIDASAFEEYLADFLHSEKTDRFEVEEEMGAPGPVADESGKEAAGLEFDNPNPQVWNELGTVYFNSGAFDNAILAYKQAIELDPQFAWANSNLALAYAQQDRFDEAVLLYKRSIELFQSAKEKAAAWNRLGNLYRHHQRYDDAIAAYQAADELDPESVSLALRSRFSLLGNLPLEEPACL